MNLRSWLFANASASTGIGKGQLTARHPRMDQSRSNSNSAFPLVQDAGCFGCARFPLRHENSGKPLRAGTIEP